MTYVTSQEERTWGMLCHLAAFAGVVLPSFGNIIGPLIVWLIYKDRFPFVDDQGRESLNFQISMTIYGAILVVFASLIGFVTLGLGFILVIPALIVFVIVQVVLVIMAAVSANGGTPYRYPLAIRFL